MECTTTAAELLAEGRIKQSFSARDYYRGVGTPFPLLKQHGCQGLLLCALLQLCRVPDLCQI